MLLSSCSFAEWWNLPQSLLVNDCALRGCSFFIPVHDTITRIKDSIPITLLILATRMFRARSGYFPYTLMLWIDANGFLSKFKGVGFELEWAVWGMEPSWAEAGVQGRGNRSWAGEGWVQGLFELSWRGRQKVEGRLGEQVQRRLNHMKRRTGSEESKKQQE